ncbi:MAG: CDP-glycerol glycerophosphotransferase family protein [Erysipelotrichaceae bacterium]|nr:CDP-glycerol glycerophosphotransferase family protein [Clostridia bacterium]MBQ6217206.1 CDP-glycerol glycerophosphotransferase family protein [Erysipelotrichaceae bacterium]
MRYQIKILIYAIIRIIYRIFWLHPLKDKIVLCSYGGRGYSDNPQHVADAIKRERPSIDICCVVLDINIEVPKYVRKIKKNSVGELLEYATARIIINNTRFPLYLAKRKGQMFVETWHGCFPLKKIGYAMEDITPLGKALVKHDSDITDIFLSGSKYLTNIIKRDFKYNGTILEKGVPRLDVLFDTSNIDCLYEQLNIKRNCKILIYAPTFRDNGRTDVYDIDFERLKNALEERYGGEWVILVRFHPNIAEYADSLQYSSWLINATVITDIYDIMKITDIMITDYSSIGQEFSYYLKRPVLLYAKDMDEFQNDRGMYYKIQDLPYPIAENNDQLISLVKTYSFSKDNADLNAFFNEAGFVGNGNTSKEVAEYIISYLQI